MALIGLSAVRDTSDTQLLTFQTWTLRIRPAESQPRRLLLLIHGWTGDENSMWVFVRRFPRNYWVLAPRAPYLAQPAGYSWRGEGVEPGHQPAFDDFRPAVAGLIGLADAYAAANDIDDREFDAIGFSQGAAVVNALALLHPARVGRLGILAGFMPPGAESLIQGKPLEGKPCFVAHASRDDRVNIEDARRSVRLLEQAGARVTFCEDEVGHKIGAGCLRSLEAFFA